MTTLKHARILTRMLPAAAALACVAGLAAGVPANASPARHDFGFPTWASGKVVNPATGNPVARVLVTFREPGDLTTVVARDRTNAMGKFYVDGLDSDEYAIKYNGSVVHYETGFQACNKTVVPTFGAACTFAPGAQGTIRLDHN